MDEGDDPAGLVRGAVAWLRGFFGKAERRHVDRYSPIAGFRKRGQRLPPHLAPGTGAMDEEDGRTGRRSHLLNKEFEVAGRHKPAGSGCRLLPRFTFAIGGLPRKK